MCADLEQFPISRAIAASNGFPGLFSPVTLTNRAKECGGREPGWLTSIPRAQRDNPLSPAGRQMAERYLDQQKTPYVHLADGGVADNLALRGAGGLMQETAPQFARSARVGSSASGAFSSSALMGKALRTPRSRSTNMWAACSRSCCGRAAREYDRYNFETLIAVGEQVQGCLQADRRSAVRERAGDQRHALRRREGRADPCLPCRNAAQS